MRQPRPLFAPLLLAFLLLFTTLAQAANDLPSADSVRESLAALEARKLPEAEHKSLQDSLQKTLANLERLRDSDARLAALKQQLASAPQQTERAQHELAQLQPVNTVPR